MKSLASTFRQRPLALALIATSLAVVAFTGVALLAAPQRTPLAPGLEGALTYVVEDGSYVTVDAGRPQIELQVPNSVSAAPAPEQSVPGSYTSPDGRYVATVRIDEHGTYIDVTSGASQITSYWIASPTDPRIVLSAKGPARAVEGVPLTIAWSPDSRRLAFGSVSGAPWSLAVVSVGSWSRAGYEVRGGYVGELAWSPNSTILAISTYEIDRSDHNVLIFDLATRTVRDLIDGCAIVWSPNGQFLAVHREPAVESGVWMTTPDGLTRFEATPDPMAFPVSWIERTS